MSNPNRPTCASRARTLSALAASVLSMVACSAPIDLPVTLDEDPGLPQHSIYAPTEAAQVNGLLPIVAWGEGACMTPGGFYREFLSAIAARGYLVIADLGINQFGTDTPELLTEGITWAIAENGRPGSRFYQRLDPTKVAVMGHSCGGLLALHVGGDPRVTTVVAWDSGIFDVGSLGGATKADLQELHGPTLWVNGGPLDIAYPQAESDFAQVPASVPAVWANYDLSEKGPGLTGAHYGTFSERHGGEFARVGGLWLDYALKGDTAARDQFVGPCGLCDAEKWTVESKGF